MCEQFRWRDGRGKSEDEEAQKLNNHWTEKCLPESASSLVANVRSNYNQNVKKIIWGEQGRKRLGNVLSVAMDERKSNMFSSKLFCPGLRHTEHTVIIFLLGICYPENNTVGDSSGDSS